MLYITQGDIEAVAAKSPTELTHLFEQISGSDAFRKQYDELLQAQAKALQAQPRLAADEARRLLDASAKPLAPALQLSVSGDRVTVTLKGLTADALAQWLAQVRQNLRVLPAEARLRRNAAGLWDGSLVLQLAAP